MDTLASVTSPRDVASGYRADTRPDRDPRQSDVDDQPLSFWDVLDAINPLQHIPVVNTVYRELTGDTIKTPLKLIGATVLGGPIGFAGAMVDSVVAETTGRDLGEHAMALVRPVPGAMTAIQVADAREFIPEPVAPQAVRVASSDREFIPPPIAMPTPAKVQSYALREAAPPPAPSPDMPSEAEVMIAASQIAAKAHVRVPVKSREFDPAPVAETPRKVNLSAGRFTSPAAIDADARALKMPSRRADFAMTETAAAVRARTKTPAGLRGGANDPAPAAIAAAAKKTYERPPAASEQYEYARRAADGAGDGTVPTWFNDAMTTSLAKYQALKRDSKTSGEGL
ncbi:MAG: hypothetical protein FJX59_01375 [Alphaproteobacteria bacterium]|nr:hypothetical protein [Alphaproteobacteria bacterium]